MEGDANRRVSFGAWRRAARLNRRRRDRRNGSRTTAPSRTPTTTEVRPRTVHLGPKTPSAAQFGDGTPERRQCSATHRDEHLDEPTERTGPRILGTNQVEDTRSPPRTECPPYRPGAECCARGNPLVSITSTEVTVAPATGPDAVLHACRPGQRAQRQAVTYAPSGNIVKTTRLTRRAAGHHGDTEQQRPDTPSTERPPKAHEQPPTSSPTKWRSDANRRRSAVPGAERHVSTDGAETGANGSDDAPSRTRPRPPAARAGCERSPRTTAPSRTPTATESAPSSTSQPDRTSGRIRLHRQLAELRVQVSDRCLVLGIARRCAARQDLLQPVDCLALPGAHLVRMEFRAWRRSLAR